MLEAGVILDNRYRIDAKLGEGGMGVVYKAFDMELEKAIALKTLLPQLVGDASALRDLRKEVALSQGLNHPNIVGVYHLETRAESPYITMEYIDGQVFSNYLAEHGLLSEEEFKLFAGQILDAIGYAHERGVIHRDLKPHNMMLDSNGRLLIMDFGIAAAVKETYTRMTGQAITGTVIYMAPEYIRGGSPDKRADIYSLGCIFYEMLSGKPPFWRGEITYQHLSEQPQPLSGVSEALNAAVLRGLSKDPADRFQSAEEWSREFFGERRIGGATSRHRRLEGGAGDADASHTRRSAGSAGSASVSQGAKKSERAGGRTGLAWKAFWGLLGVLVILLVTTLTLLSGGGGEVDGEKTAGAPSGGGGDGGEAAYAQALRENSIESWKRFLARYPASGHAEEARRKVRALEELANAENLERNAEKDFKTAKDLDTLEAWNDFLSKHPDSDHAREAQERLAALKTEAESRAQIARQEKERLEAEAFSAAEAADSIEAWEKFVAKYPRSNQISKARGRLERLREDAKIPKEITNGKGMRFRLIPAGEFTMGAVTADARAGNDEKPRHNVRISKPFYISAFEITQSQFESVTGNNPSKFRGSDKPVESVSWDEAVEFCNKLSQLEGGKYRLPTEAEWEYACRAGSSTTFYWGDSMDDRYAWHAENSDNQTQPAGRKLPNSWGLYDMSGNVCEWCADWYGSDYYGMSGSLDPQGPSTGKNRVIRGNAWNANPGILRTSFRLSTRPDNRSNSIGFRVVLEVAR